MFYLTLYNGLKMPVLGLGTWQATQNAMEKALESALEIGYRHIDTAILYENENDIGNVIKRWITSGRVKREDLFITTKLPPMGMYEEKVDHYMQSSLNNLQLDYVDLYLIHSPEGIKNIPENKEDLKMDTNVDHKAVWKKLEEQVSLGRTKSIGVSNFNKAQIENILKFAKIKPANLQIELHLYMQQKELVQFCKSNGITVTAYSPLGSPGMKEFYESYGKTKQLPNLLENQVVQQIACSHHKTPAQVLLRHILQNDIAAVPKSSNPKRLRENFEVFDFELSNEEMKTLDDLDFGETGRIGDWESWTWV